uniref:Cytochrome P450 n=1 Tax=Fibrocapsa japonica TaxID=94617 RepID=A0A7S2V5X3_9STRA
MKKVSVEQAKLWIEQRLTPFVESGRSFDVAKEMVGLTMSIICEAAFEYQMDQKEKDDFLFELELVLKEYTFKSSVNPFRAMVGLLLPERRRAAKGARRIQGIARKVVNNYRRLQSPVKGTVIDLIMKCDAFQNDDERMREVLSFLIAGHDTTGYSLSWTLLELARNPDEMDKLRKSIEIISEEDRNKSDALHAVVKESMRLHPVAAGGSIRKTGKDIMKDGEVVIPRGATVFLPLILFLRNPEYFENPGVFKPSRWHNPTEKATSAFFPFSLGKQNCVGQALANAELHTVTALLCSSYSFKVENEGKEEYFLTYKPAGARLKAYKFRPVPAF